jgi:hypothetical protein
VGRHGHGYTTEPATLSCPTGPRAAVVSPSSALSAAT